MIDKASEWISIPLKEKDIRAILTKINEIIDYLNEKEKDVKYDPIGKSLDEKIQDAIRRDNERAVIGMSIENLYMDIPRAPKEVHKILDKLNEVINYLNKQSQFRDYTESSLKICTELYRNEKKELLDLISAIMAKVLGEENKHKIIKYALDELSRINDGA